MNQLSSYSGTVTLVLLPPPLLPEIVLVGRFKDSIERELTTLCESSIDKVGDRLGVRIPSVALVVAANSSTLARSARSWTEEVLDGQ